jgi:hypothetical protein
MHLHRVTPDAFENYNMFTGGKYLGQAADYFKCGLDGEPANRVVVAHFNRFGGGQYRKSDYEVLSDWSDVEELIERFCEAGHPSALALREARELAEAIKKLGWQPPTD